MHTRALTRVRRAPAHRALRRAASLCLAALAACGGDRKEPTAPAGGGDLPAGYRGTLTLARDGARRAFAPTVVADLDLASGNLVSRFDGLDAHRTSSGETAFLTTLSDGGGYATVGVVVADARGVTGPPLYVCPYFDYGSERTCATPRLSPAGRLVAFSARESSTADPGVLDNWVIVRDRTGADVARYEGYVYPDWLPDGRLLMLGDMTRGAGVWTTDAALRTPTRVDANQVGTPATSPAVSPDGRRVALVWNKQLWVLGLDEQRELTQLTAFATEVASAAWSPDGTAFAVLTFDVSLPVRALMFFRPGDQSSLVVRQLPFYPYGPLSWH
jgi:WD40-like Beta Propeller Repeat